MDWYSLLAPEAEKWVTLAVLVVTFALLLRRRFNIAYVSLASAGLLVLLGITGPLDALLRSVNWDVLTVYWGYGMLAIAFREGKIPAWIANEVLSRVQKEKHALLFLCALAMVLSTFMANPVVVIMLAPMAIEMAGRTKTSLFVYLISLAISSNVVTTVTMVSDPPALILAGATGMDFLDFYWFQGKLSLGTLSVIGALMALATLVIRFRKLDRRITMGRERVKVSHAPLLLFALSVLALALVPWKQLGNWNHPGLVGLVLGVSSLAASPRGRSDMLREFDWNSIVFLIGIFIVIDTTASVGLLRDLSTWLGGSDLGGPAVYLAIFVWVSVALSSFMDNVPYTMLMIPVCAQVALLLGVSPFPFYFGMLVGTGIGGNITPVGATANVLACAALERHGHKVELRRYLALAVPFSLPAVIVVHALLQLIWL